MRLHLCLAILLLSGASWLQGASFAPAVPGTAGQRAFDDLARLYSDAGGPDLPALWVQLHAADAATRQTAGEYLLALCRQSIDDEVTGRTAHSRLPPGFGQRAPLHAREFRKQLADQLPAHAAAVESLPAIQWLLDHDVLAQTQVQAAKALRQIQGPAADALLLALLSPPHPNGAVLTLAIEEVADRKLPIAADTLRSLAIHYRTTVRHAAQKTAATLGVTDLPAYTPEAALSARFDPVLQQIAVMVLTPIPPEATFVLATIQNPATENRPARTTIGHGWLLSQTADAYHILDEYGEELDLPKARTTVTPESLATRAQVLRDLRDEETRAAKRNLGGSGALSRNGSLSGQFEPPQIRLPEILIGVWAYQRHDKTAAALVLLPRLEELEDERWFREIARDLLGHYYHQQMLTRFADYWDYPGAQRLAQHLSLPVFDGFEYQYRATSLMAQLSGHAGRDFHDLSLPTPAQWHRQRRQLTRTEQITFLADRLHLISVRQAGWPSPVNLRDEQRSEPCNGGIYADIDRARGQEVINPYVELWNMTLAPSELPVLIPYLANDDYLRTYHCWRPWHPGWEVFQVNELVEALINDAAGVPLADLGDYYTTLPAERPQYLATLTRNATTRTQPRLVRALLDWRALWQHPADPILGLLSCAAGGLWYWWRRAAPGLARLGAAVFVSAGVVSLLYPALQHQRVLLNVDTLPLLLGAAAASVVLWHRLEGSARRGWILAAAALATAWLVERYVYLDPLLDPYQLAAALLLLWPTARMLRQSRRGWVWLSLAALFVIAALVNGLLLEVMCRRYHIRLSPDFEPPFLLSHPVWTAAVLLACGCWLLGLWRQCSATMVPLRQKPSPEVS